VWGVHDFDPFSGSPSGCGWYRVILPLSHLAANGWNAAWREGVPPPAADGYKVLVAQRLDKPEALPIWRRSRLSHRLVYETDDDWFSIDPSRFSGFSNGRGVFLDSVVHAAQVADIVTVSTGPLAEVMARETGHRDIRVLGNCVPGALLGLERNRNRRKVVIGWGGGATHAPDLALVTPALREFLASHKNAELHMMGADFREQVGCPVRFTEWVPADASLAYYRGIDFDIGLAPLTGTRFDASKCVDSSMRISTDRGALEAGSLEPGMKVWRDGWRRIEAVERGVPRPGLLFRMAGGYQLKLTPEHRMLVNGEWVQASEIRPGDTIAMEAESARGGTPERVAWPADGRMSRAYKGRPAADPDAFLVAEDGPKLDITERWGRFLGAFAGDGSVGQATVIQISCDGQDQDWIDLLMDDLRAFGLNPRTEEIKTFDGTVLRRRGVRAASAHLLRVLASIGVTASRPSGKPIRVPCVPEVIWRSPKPVIAEFLAAYFEADGHCTGGGVQVTSKTEQLIRDTQRLLLLFGITSSVKSRIYKAQNGFSGLYWTCTLRRREADVFAKEISFRSHRKSALLDRIVSRPPSNAAAPMNWWRRVALIEPCFVDPVDIQVEGSAFILAGFVSHNSAIKALEYMALGIPVLASDVEAYRGLVIDGVNGYLIRRKADWGRRLHELACDVAAREEMGAKARETARAHTIEANWHKWAEIYAELQ
jgi:hypothetical protein